MIDDQHFTAPISLHSSDTAALRGDDTDTDNSPHIEDGTERNTSATLPYYADNPNIFEKTLTLIVLRKSHCDDQHATVTDGDSVDTYGYLKPTNSLK